MKKLIHYALPLLALFMMGAWDYSVDKNKAVLMIADDNEKISLLEHGKVDKEIFSEGIKAMAVMDKQEKCQISRYLLTYVPQRGDAIFVTVYQEKNHIGETNLPLIRSLANKLKENDMLIIDNIQAVNQQGNKIILAPIVLKIK